jgi:chemotaxis protein MotB
MTIGFDGSQWIKQKVGITPGPEPGIIPAPVTPPQSKPTTDSPKHQTLYDKLKTLLASEIQQGKISLSQTSGQLQIRFPEKFSFASGSDELLKSFIPIIKRIGEIIDQTPGNIIIAGHTDDVPINTERFRSNWELSAARAVSVAHALFDYAQVQKKRVRVEGYAETRPLVENDSFKHRAINRRVEISIDTSLEQSSVHDRE